MDMDRYDDPHDREGLDPVADPAGWESLVGAVVARAEPILEARRRERTLVSLLADRARPALAVAATVLLAVVGGTVLFQRDGSDSGGASALASTIVPGELAVWLVADYRPTVTELILALEEDVSP